MIRYRSPFSIQKDLGKAYNDEADSVLNPEDWLCFVDADAMFLTPDYGVQLQELIDKYPDTGLFTCLTNRVGSLIQCHNGIINDDPSMLNHRRIALQLQRENRHIIREVNHVISGVLMMVKKATWDLIHGAPEGRGLLAIDNHISQRVLNAGLKIRIMMGVYVLHFYRLDVGIHNKDHLIITPQIAEETKQVVTQPRKKRSRFLP